MSYREMRNFTETMRALGYPRLISMENFRSPNFKLIAEILCWLAYRFDSNADIPFSIDSEQDRVIFIKLIAQFMLNKAHVRLNTKKLYQADGYAVKELLKLTTLLYQATKGNVNADEESENTDALGGLDATKVQEMKEARQLASQITTKGAVLYDLLGQDIDLREERRLALGRNLDLQDIEKGVKGAIRSVEDSIRKIQVGLENIAADEANLEAKIEKKRNEVERNKKRLSTLQSVRPAYMDEYEQLEEELQSLYNSYLVKYRNLAYLESMYEEFVNVETERNLQLDMNSKVLSEQMRETAAQEKKAKLSGDEDELGGLLDGDDDESDDEEESSTEEELPKEVAMRSAYTAAVARRQMSQKVAGNEAAVMGNRSYGAAKQQRINEDAEDSMDSMGVNDDNDDDEDDDSELGTDDSDGIMMGNVNHSGMGGNPSGLGASGSRRVPRGRRDPQQALSDEDF